MSWSACVPPERTFLRASSSSPSLIATAVWVALCGSTPMITAMDTSEVSCRVEPRRALLLRVDRARSSFEPHRGEIPARRSSLESQANNASRQAPLELRWIGWVDGLGNPSDPAIRRRARLDDGPGSAHAFHGEVLALPHLREPGLVVVHCDGRVVRARGRWGVLGQ